MLRVNPINRVDVVKAKSLAYLRQYGACFPETRCLAKRFPDYCRAARVDADAGLAFIDIAYTPKTSRLFADPGLLSLQAMPRIVRNTLLPDGAQDLDIKCAAPTLVAGLCRRHDIPTPQLQYLLDNLQEVHARGDLGPNPKDMRNRLLFGSATMNPADLPSAFARGLHTEVTGIIDQLRAIHPQLYAKAEAADREEPVERGAKRAKRDRRPNGGGKFLSWLYFQEEARVLAALDQAGRTAGFWDDRVAFVFDGMIILDGKEFENADLRLLEEAINASTGAEVTLVLKPCNDQLDIDITAVPHELVATDDNAGANLVLQLLDGQVVASGMQEAPCIYVRCDNGLWSDHYEQVDRYLLDKITGFGIQLLKDDDKVVPYSANVANAVHLRQLVKTRIPFQPDLGRDIVLGSEGKLAFINGYWDFLPECVVEHEHLDGEGQRCDPGLCELPTALYGRFQRGGSFDTVVRVNRRFGARVQEDIDFVRERIIDPMFIAGKPGQKERLLQAIGRALAGHIDKLCNLLVGGRDSGKSVIMQFVRNAIGGYSANLHSGVFSGRSTAQDCFREFAWVFNLEHARVAVVSEAAAAAGNGHKFSGDALKKVQSVKEGIMARQLRMAQREVFSLCTVFMCLNDVPDFDPVDAVEKCHIYNFGTSFVTPEVKALPDNVFSAAFIVREPAVEHWIREVKYLDALLWILFEAYRPRLVVPTEEMNANVEQLQDETGLPMYDRVFDITLDEDDRVRQTDVLHELKKIKPSINHTKITMDLEKIMGNRLRALGREPFKVDSYIGNGHSSYRPRAYKGLKLRTADVGHFNDSGFVDGFMP